MIVRYVFFFTQWWALKRLVERIYKKKYINSYDKHIETSFFNFCQQLSILLGGMCLRFLFCLLAMRFHSFLYFSRIIKFLGVKVLLKKLRINF